MTLRSLIDAHTDLIEPAAIADSEHAAMTMAVLCSDLSDVTRDELERIRNLVGDTNLGLRGYEDTAEVIAILEGVERTIDAELRARDL